MRGVFRRFVDWLLGKDDIDRAVDRLVDYYARCESECAIHINPTAPLAAGTPAIICESCRQRGAALFGPATIMTVESAQRLREAVSA